MPVRRILPDVAYGVGDALIPLAPLPIIARRDPTSNDLAQLGTTWVTETTGAVWILSQVVANSANWVTSPVIGGVGVFTSLEVTSGNLLVDLGGINVGSGAFTVSNSGDVTVAGDLTVNGTLTFTGTLDFDSAAEIQVTSTFNGAPSVAITANGGANEQIYLHSVQGTAINAIRLRSELGGVSIEADNNTANAIVLNAFNASGGISMDTGTGGLTVLASNGPIQLSSGTGAISIGTESSAHNITIGNVTGSTEVVVNTGSGGFSVLTTNAGLALSSGTGVINISADGAATTVNVATANAAKTLTLGSTNAGSSTTLRSGAAGMSINSNGGALTMVSGTGAMNISNDAAATTVNVATGAAVKSVTVGSTTGASATTINAGSAGVTLGGAFVALPGPVYIYTGAGAPNNALALHVGDMYINTTAASAATRLYIATAASTWTNVTCAA